MTSIHPCELNGDHIGALVRWEDGKTIHQGTLTNIEHGRSLHDGTGFYPLRLGDPVETRFTVGGATILIAEQPSARIEIIKERA